MQTTFESFNEGGQTSDAHASEGVAIRFAAERNNDDTRSIMELEKRRIAESAQNLLPHFEIGKDGSISFEPGVDASTSNEITRLAQSAQAIHKATGQENWIARWADNETIIAVLKEKNDEERLELSQIYKMKFGIELEDDLKKNMSGANLDLALNLLRRKDGDILDQAAGTIQTDLTDINQILFGRKRSELETEIRNLLASKNSGQIARIDEDFFQRTHIHLRDAIMSNEKISKESKNAVEVYLKGADKRTDSDALALAQSALQHKDLTGFQEAMRDASPQARARFLECGGTKYILQAFGELVSRDDRTGELVYRATPQSTHALDYAENGKLSAAQQIRDNTGMTHFTSNIKGVEAALASMTDEERNRYELGRAVIEGRNVDTKPSPQEEAKAVSYYKDLNDAMGAVGNSTELLAWQDQIKYRGGTLVSALSRHRGAIYDDSVDAMCTTVEKNMSQSDWQRLHDPKTGPQFRAEVEALLKTYCKDAEVDRVMDVVDRKAHCDSFAEALVEHRSLTDALDDHTHWYKRNDRAAMLNDIANMSLEEQEKYRSDERYRQEIDGAIEDKLGSPAREAAQALLQKILKNEKPELGLLGTLQLHESDWSDEITDARNLTQDLAKFFKEEPTLRERINNPQTEADKNLSEQVLKVLHSAMTDTGYQSYIKPMLETGSLPVEKLIGLDLLSGNRQEIYKDLASATDEERSALLTDSNRRNSVLQCLSENEKAVAINALRQGALETEDSLRSYIVSWGRKDEIVSILRTLNAGEIEALKTDYANKYGCDLLSDLVEKLGGDRKIEAESILLSTKQTAEEHLNDVMQLGSMSHSGFGAGFVDSVGNVGTGYQIDATINNTIQQLAEAAKSGSSLSTDQVEALAAQLETVDKNYRESKASVADNAVNVTMAAAAVGGAAFTGGASLGLLAAMVPAGAAIKFGEKALILGNDYDFTTGQILSDTITGGINAGVNVIGPAQIGALLGVERATMGAATEIGLSALSGGVGGGIAGGAAAIADQRSGGEILQASAEGGATGFVLAGTLSAATVGLRTAFKAWGSGAPEVESGDLSTPAGDSVDVPESQAAARIETPEPSVASSIEVPEAPSNLMARLSAEAQAKGYGTGPALYAIENLTDPDEIAQFARAYNEQYPGVALENMQYASTQGRVMPGTEDAWKAALANLNGPAPGDLAVKAVADDAAPSSGIDTPNQVATRAASESDDLVAATSSEATTPRSISRELTADQVDAYYKQLSGADGSGAVTFTKNPELQYQLAQVNAAENPNGLIISTKESTITLTKPLTLADGTVLPEGTSLPYGVQISPASVEQVGKELKTIVGGRMIVPGEGVTLADGTVLRTIDIPNDADFQIFKGQVANAGTADKPGDWIVLRQTTDSSGNPIYDAYTNSNTTKLKKWVPVADQPGVYNPFVKPGDPPRQMVQLPPSESIEFVSSYGEPATVSEPSFLARDPSGKGYYIISYKDVRETMLAVDPRSQAVLDSLRGGNPGAVSDAN